jgi:aminopeptidase N
VANLMALPSETLLAEQMEVVDVTAIHTVRQRLRVTIATALRDRLIHSYENLATDGEYRFSADDAGRRSLRNLCLAYLMALEDDTAGLELCERQYHDADNMTDTMAALAALSNRDCPQRETALAHFYETWRREPLVVNKWFSVQATSRLPATLDRVRELGGHEAFTLKNPNRVRALIGAFSQANPLHFHAADGGGYRLLADYVMEIDDLNPQLAARLVGALSRWRRHDRARQQLMRAELQRIAGRRGLSRDVFEIVTKSLV